MTYASAFKTSASRRSEKMEDLDVATHELRDHSLPSIVKKDSAGRSYTIYTENIYHSSYAWRVKKGLIALAATFFSCGLALISKSVRKFWHECISGIETKQIKVLTRLNPTDEKTKNIGSNKFSSPTLLEQKHSAVKKEVNPLPSFSSPTYHSLEKEKLSSTFTPQALPEESTSIPKSALLPQSQSLLFQLFFPSTKEIESLNTKEIPPILTLEPKEAQLNQPGNLFTETHDRYHNRIEGVMKQPLHTWLQREEHEMRQITGLHEEGLFSFQKRIEDRLNQFNQSFQLLPRFRRLAKNPLLKKLKIKDLEAAWEQSTLKIFLLDEEEVSNMSIDAINKLSTRQAKFLSQQATMLRKKELGLAINSAETLKKLTLWDLRQVNISSLELVIEHLSSNLIECLTEEQKLGLNIDLLSAKQFRIIYKNEKRIKALSASALVVGLNNGLFDGKISRLISFEQVRNIDFTQVNLYKQEHNQMILNTIIDTITKKDKSLQSLQQASLLYLLPFINPIYLRHLTPEQIQAIDFKNEKITQAMVSGIIGWKGWQQTNSPSNLQFFTPQQIINCLQRNLFNSEALQSISGKQVEQLDFTQLDLYKLEQDPLIFDCLNTIINRLTIQDSSLKSLQEPSFLYLLPLLKPVYLNYLTQQQIQRLDFKKENITQAMVDGIVGESRTNKKNNPLEFFEPQQIIDCLQRDLLSPQAARLLSAKKIKQIDFTKIELLTLSPASKAAINVFMHTLTTKDKSLQNLGKSSFLYLLPIIPLSLLNYLSREQIQAIDFKKESITPDMLKGILGVDHISRPIKTLEFFMPAQIIDCLKRDLFDMRSAFSLTPQQIAQIDLKKIEPKTEVTLALIRRHSPKN
ncbi:hypothetical protein DB42_AC00220 [Neochlamydia sp. EPS4]|uniref:hypothetical protein n=1 Tax=Neochlamydia sp. EPS4 TaxID=1478175 RepID=UPI0005827AE3|nr:hypothetical protein [Neochlamydia sp. EPS4]KIC75416.1 hypothetical protein DB42_AC00220 [Neochlamydia sp. EPS4]